MPVAVRKRSWEEQYSYDDLDLVCCHELGRKGSWVTAGPKQGRRTRCASMPEGCPHELAEVRSQTVEVAAPSIEVYCGFSAESKTHISEARCIQTQELESDQNSGISRTNISCASDSIVPTENICIGDVGSREGYHFGNYENALKSPRTCEEQQCCSIHSNNESTLCAADGPGNSPNQQETKESHATRHSVAPQISDATVSQTANLPHVGDALRISELDAAQLSAKGPDSSVVMGSGCVSPRTRQTVEAVVMRAAEEEQCDKGLSQILRQDCADRRDGLNDPGGHLIENKDHHLKSIRAGGEDCQEKSEPLAGAPSGEIANQMLLQQQASTMGRPNEEKSEECTAEPEHCDILAKHDEDVNVTASKQQHPLEEPTQTSTIWCANEQIINNCTIDLTEETVVDQTTDPESTPSTLDIIPESTLAEAEAKQRLNLTALEPVPDGPTAEKQTREPQLLSFAEVGDEVVPAGRHGNRAPGHQSRDSPAAEVAEVADGPREHHATTDTESTMEAANVKTHTTGESLKAAKEDGVVKVRERKCEQVRLDSMILLLMKLDQLDQEIENALSATSSMGSTPTFPRHNLQDFDGSGTATLRSSPQPSDSASPCAPEACLGAKPKNGVSHFF